MRRSLAAAVAALALITVAGCSGDESPTGGASPDAGSSAEPSSDAGDDPTDAPTGEPGDEPTADDTEPPVQPVGTWKDASSIEPREALLDWESTSLAEDGLAAGTRDWTGVVDTLGKRAVLTGPDDRLQYRAPQGRIQFLEMQWPWAVLYSGDEMAGVDGEGEIEVFDLRTGKSRSVAETASAPAASGSFAMHDGRIAYSTVTDAGYCLVTVDLDTLDEQQVACADPRKEGLTQFRLTSDAVGYTSFDDRRPTSCMTLNTARGDEPVALTAAKKCAGWEVVPGDSTMWLQVTNPNRVERSTAYGVDDNGKVVKLGPAMSGSSTWCGGAAYFIRPPSTDGRANDLVRWTPEDGLETVWTPEGRSVAFVFSPHCGGDTIALPGLDGNQSGIVLTAEAS